MAAALTLGDGVPNPLTASPRERLFVIVASMVLGGVILGWKWEAAGCLLVFGGLALFAAADEAFLLNIIFAPWLVTGLSYLVCWVGKRRVGEAAPVQSGPTAAGHCRCRHPFE